MPELPDVELYRERLHVLLVGQPLLRVQLPHLHRARLSPLAWTSRLSDGEVDRLFAATRSVLREFLERLRAGTPTGIPERVTAFRPDMAVHGRYGQPCPVCGATVQRIRYAAHETNYCARCQTGGRLLADRALSRLLKDDWPRSIDDLE
jgi:formamidopyrimidine-DNA glycosylase